MFVNDTNKSKLHIQGKYVHLIQGILTKFQSRIFYLSTTYLKPHKLNSISHIFSYCDAGVKLGFSHLVKNIDWCCMKTQDEKITYSKWEYKHWRQVQSEGICVVLSPNTGRLIKFRRMNWVGLVACMENRCAYKILMGKHEGRKHFEILGIYERVILQ